MEKTIKEVQDEAGRSFPVREKKINKDTTETGLIMEFYTQKGTQSYQD